MEQTLKDVNPTQLSSSPEAAANVGGTLFFSAVSRGDREPWRSDGTEAGTVLDTDIFPDR